MTFGEKLLKLRKEHGLSQEALAEKLSTSRQAISKWENDQGYPETEKLLMIGNVFNVSLDYLLKDTVEKSEHDETGYYVSKEMAEGYLFHQKKMFRYMAFGISFLILTYIPYLIFKDSFIICSIIIAAMVTAGIGAIVIGAFMEDEYKVLQREALVFDYKYLEELKQKYADLKKKYIILIVIALGCIFSGGTVIFLGERYFGGGEVLTPYLPVCTFLIAVGVYLFIYAASMIEVYDLLVKNEEYVNTISFKMLKKIRKKKEML